MSNRIQYAVAYMRVEAVSRSADAQFNRQRNKVHRYARTHGFEIVAEFKDTTIPSPAGLKNRRGLAALLDYIDHNWVEAVLVENAECLSYELILSEVILSQFRDLNVRVIAADSGVELTSIESESSCKLIRKVLRVVTKFHKSMLALKLKAARERIKQQKGRCEGRRPFGYYPHEQEALKRIQELHFKTRGAQSLGYYRIATILNKEGYRTRSGRPWIGPTVRGIVQRNKKRRTK